MTFFLRGAPARALWLTGALLSTGVSAAPAGRWGWTEGAWKQPKLFRPGPWMAEPPEEIRAAPAAPTPGAATLMVVPAEAPAGSTGAPHPEVSAPAVVVPELPPAPYRGSTLAYRNTVSAIAFNPAAEPTYNPFYAMQLSLQPRYWFNKKIYARGSFDVLSEITQSDSTNDRFVIGDLGLAAGADGFYSIPVVGVDVSAELSLSLPTSKSTQASTRVLSTSASWVLARKFFGALGLTYAGNVDKYWNRATTGSPTGYLVGVCDLGTNTGCVDRLINTGRRNADWALTNGLSASFKANKWLSFSLGVGVSTVFLYGLPEVEAISLRIKDPASARFLMQTSAGVSVKPTDELTVGFALRSAYAQLAPDGSYRVPLFNRFTQLSVELGLNIASLVARIRS